MRGPLGRALEGGNILSAPKFTGHVLLLLTASLCGCHSWDPFVSDTSNGAAQRLPNPVRVTRPDSGQMVLTEAAFRGDTLYGNADGQAVAFPTDHIVRLEREKVNVAETLGLTIGVPAALAGAICLIECGNGGEF